MPGFDEACGIRNPHGISYEEKMSRYLAHVGQESVEYYIPVPLDDLPRLYAADRNLNNVPLSKWEKAAGYPGLPSRQGEQPPRSSGGFPRMLMSHGITEFSVSECVSLLKHAAEAVALRRLSEPTIYDDHWAVFEHCHARPDSMNRYNIFDYDCVGTFKTEKAAIDCEQENPEHRIRKLVRGKREKDGAGS